MKVVGFKFLSNKIIPEVGDKYRIKGIVSEDLKGDHTCIIKKVGEDYMSEMVIIESLLTGKSIWYPKAKIRRKDFMGNDCPNCCP